MALRILLLTLFIALTGGALGASGLAATAVYADGPLATPTPRPPRPQIVGGTAAPAGAWPSQVAIVGHNPFDGPSGVGCGGTLIAAEWILTAAHCFVNGATGIVTPGTDRDFIIGRLDLVNGTDGQRIRGQTVIPHPSYDRTTSNNDIALVRLSAPMTGPLMPIATPADDGLMAAGKQAWVVGWGTTSSGGTVSPVLLQVDVPVVSNDDCNGPASYNGGITAAMLCAGWPAVGLKDACQGDSGGPLMSQPTGGGAFKQIGVVSFGRGCADPNFPGVYARVSMFAAWINEQINPTPAANRLALPILTRQAVQ